MEVSVFGIKGQFISTLAARPGGKSGHCSPLRLSQLTCRNNGLSLHDVVLGCLVRKPIKPSRTDLSNIVLGLYLVNLKQFAWCAMAEFPFSPRFRVHCILSIYDFMISVLVFVIKFTVKKSH